MQTTWVKMSVLAGALVLGTAQMGLAAEQAAPKVGKPSVVISETVAGTYVLDTKHASVHWSVSHLGFSNYTARFDKLVGTARVKPDDLSKSGVTVTIDAASANTGFAVMDEKLAGPEFFDAKQFPKIQFESTDVKVTGSNADGKPVGQVTGNLTMRGVTKPLVLDVVFNGHGVNPFGAGQTLGFSATGKLNRQDFGLSAVTGAVGDEVTLKIEAEFNLVQ